MLLAIALVTLGSQLAQAEISIELTDSTATVEAHYEFSESGTAFEAFLILILNQSLERLDSNGTPTFRVSWERGAGMIWIGAPAALDGSPSVALRYRVRGRLERIPIPVPNQPAEPGRGSVILSVRGLDPTSRFLDGFPRLAPLDGGIVQARLDNVPSFLRRPPAAASWSVSRLAQLFVILFIAGSSAAWIIRAYRSHREAR